MSTSKLNEKERGEASMKKRMTFSKLKYPQILKIVTIAGQFTNYVRARISVNNSIMHPVTCLFV